MGRYVIKMVIWVFTAELFQLCSMLKSFHKKTLENILKMWVVTQWGVDTRQDPNSAMVEAKADHLAPSMKLRQIDSHYVVRGGCTVFLLVLPAARERNLSRPQSSAGWIEQSRDMSHGRSSKKEHRNLNSPRQSQLPVSLPGFPRVPELRVCTRINHKAPDVYSQIYKNNTYSNWVPTISQQSSFRCFTIKVIKGSNSPLSSQCLFQPSYSEANAAEGYKMIWLHMQAKHTRPSVFSPLFLFLPSQGPGHIF
jgi:hypothetical protein